MDQTFERLSHASSFKLTFSERVTRDELIASLDKLLAIGGCLACGLNGHDWHFHAINPEFERFTNVLLDGKNSLINAEVIQKSFKQF